MKILVTSTGSVATDIVIKKLKQSGITIVGCNIYPKEWIVESCEVDVFYQVPPVSQKQEYLDSIKTICKRENINYIFPMIDYEIDLLNKNREWFELNNIILCISPKNSLDIIRDKYKLQKFVFENCPLTTSIPTKKFNDINEDTIKFPIVCKPFNGRSSQGLKYIYDRKELDDFKNSHDVSNFIVEPFIDGPIIVVEVIRQSKPHKVVAIPRREIISTPHGCSLTVLTFQDKKLEESSKVLADKLGIIGDVNFEYILSKDGNYYLIECNPRFSAGCEFACMSGYDCVTNHLKCFQGLPIDDYNFKHNLIIARKYEEYITAENIDVPYCKTNK